MLLGSFIGLVFLSSGVLSAPLDDLISSSEKKDNDLAPQTAFADHQTSADSILIKKDLIPSESKDNSASSLIKDDQGLKQEQIDEKSASEKTGHKLERTDAKMSTLSETVDKNNNDAVINDKKGLAIVEVSTYTADDKIDNEIDHEKVKEMFVKAVSTLQKNEKQSSNHELPPQKPGLSNVIENFVYEIMQAPIYFLNAVKDLLGGMFGIKQPVETRSSITASAP